MDLLGLESYDDLKDAHSKWVDSTIQTNHSDKEKKWTQSLAVIDFSMCYCGPTPGAYSGFRGFYNLLSKNETIGGWLAKDRELIGKI